MSEKRLDEFAQTHFLHIKTPIAPQYWIKLTGITYEERFETLLKTISKYQKENSKNKYTAVTNIYSTANRLGNETHLMINTTKNVIKSKLEYIMIPNDFFSLEFLGSEIKTKLTNYRTW